MLDIPCRYLMSENEIPDLVAFKHQSLDMRVGFAHLGYGGCTLVRDLVLTKEQGELLAALCAFQFLSNR